MNAAKPEGESPTDSAQTAATRSLSSGLRIAFAISALSLSMTGFGVPAGARKPYHEPA